MRPLGRELVEERPVERTSAGTEIASDEGAGGAAVGEAGVLQKAAVDETRRFGRSRDRAHDARVGEGLVARVLAGPAGGALQPGRQLLRIGEEQNRRAGDGHRPDRHRLAPVRGAAGPQHRLIILDCILAREPLGRGGRIQAGRSVARFGGARDSAHGEDEEDEGA